MRSALALVAGWIGLAAFASAGAAIDPAQVQVSRLENGLTLLVLEEPAMPVVSVQTAYRTGGRDDPDGRMGLAHFFEHMAFRASRNFPDTRLVSDIYAVGGEWHGYTWIDHITFFATAPKERLDLLLRIEADRLGRLDLAEADVAAEAGAVIAEMNGYANDPASQLFDAVAAAAFLAHPYRKNTIGYEADIRAVTHADVVRFYRDRIAPNAAVLAVVGDVEAGAVAARVEALFGGFPARPEAESPGYGEPDIAGERRVRIASLGGERIARIAYPAPSARSADFAPFLVLQAMVGAGSGVNFLQNDWGAPAPAGSPLGALSADVATWFIPTKDPYLFVVSASLPEAVGAAGETPLEAGVSAALSALAKAPPTPEAVAVARASVQRDLVFDLQTTEDAAHLLAYFEAIDALDVYLGLEGAVEKVTPSDIARVARLYLDPQRRVIGWADPDMPAPPSFAPAGADARSDRGREPPAPVDPADTEPARADAAPTFAAAGRVAALASPLSPTAAATATLAGRYECEACTPDAPGPGLTAVTVEEVIRKDEDLALLLERLRAQVAAARPADADPPSDDPATRLKAMFAEEFAAPAPAAPKAQAVFAAVAGAVDAAAAAALAERTFADILTPAGSPTPLPALARGAPRPATSTIPATKAQGALGLALGVADGTPPLAASLALYIFAHDYEGRFGKEAISRQGLAYYVGTDHQPATDGSLITLDIGVDPAKQRPLRDLLHAELGRFTTEPPDEGELAEAKAHLIGRRHSAAQSNGEIVALLARHHAFGLPLDAASYIAAVEAVTLDEVRAVARAFAAGRIITIEVGTVEVGGGAPEHPAQGGQDVDAR